MFEKEYSRITKVRVKLQGGHPFPVTLGSAACPSYIEHEIASLAEAILKPGYDTKPDPHTRLPYVGIRHIPEHYLQEDGSYDIPFGVKDIHTPLENLPEECLLVVENEGDKIRLHFNDAAQGQNIRSVSFAHKLIQEAVQAYLTEQDDCEKHIRNLQEQYATLPENDSVRKEELLLMIKRTDGYRKDTHHVGSEEAPFVPLSFAQGEGGFGMEFKVSYPWKAVNYEGISRKQAAMANRTFCIKPAHPGNHFHPVHTKCGIRPSIPVLCI